MDGPLIDGAPGLLHHVLVSLDPYMCEVYVLLCVLREGGGVKVRVGLLSFWFKWGID